MGGSNSKGQPSGSKKLARNADELYKESTPGRKEVGRQIYEALLTGGTGAQIPLIQQSVERSNNALFNTLRGLDERFVQQGLDGSPFAERIRAQAQLQGAQQTNMIAPQMGAQIAGQAPSFFLQLPTLAQQSLGQAGALQNQAKGQQLGFMASLFESGMSAAATAKASDARLKTNVTNVGTSLEGYNIYEFDYIVGNPGRYRGVMAQDLLEKGRGDAVGVDSRGFYLVDYSKIDVPFERIS